MNTDKNQPGDYNFLLITVFIMFILTFGIMFIQYFSSTLSYMKIANLESDNLENHNSETITKRAWSLSKKNPKLSLIIADLFYEKYQMSDEYQDMYGESVPNESSDDNRPRTERSDSNEYYKKAEEYYIKSINQNPLSAESHIKLGELYFAGGEKNKALISFKIAVKLDRNNAYNILKIADYFIRLGSIEEGKQMLRKANELVNPLLKRSMDVIYEITGKTEDLEAVTPQNFDSYMTLGRFLLKNGLLKEAINAFLTAKEFDPENIEPYRAIASIYKNNGEMNKVIELWNDALQINPESPQFFYNLGIAHISSGEEMVAIEKIEKAIKLTSTVNIKRTDLVNFYMALMTTYYKMDDYRNALRSADSIIQLDDRQAKAYYYKGLCEDQTKYDIKGVFVALRKATELEPQEISYRIALANAYKKYGFYKSALKEWERISVDKQFIGRASKEMANIKAQMQSQFKGDLNY